MCVVLLAISTFAAAIEENSIVVFARLFAVFETRPVIKGEISKSSYSSLRSTRFAARITWSASKFAVFAANSATLPLRCDRLAATPATISFMTTAVWRKTN